MIYLIGQLSVWLLLTAGFAALAGWMFAAQRAEPELRALRGTRERMVRDLAQLAAGDGLDMSDERDRVAEANDSLARIRESRIAELERALESARARADDASGEAAELRRQLERQGSEGEELTRLRGLVAEHEARRAQERDIETAIVEPVQPEPDENTMLQTWRLRYFEQRVRYLEGLARAPTPAVETSPEPAEPAQPILEWRARDAEARASFLEEQLRAQNAALVAEPTAPAAEEEPPFAANADVDMLLRWRLLYLERRVAHLQTRTDATPQPVTAPVEVVEAGPDPDRWKWRARYLEARVRHLEQRPVQVVAAAAAAPVHETPASEPPVEQRIAAPSRRAKPSVLPAARNGAPDDLTLIEGVSLLQQTTLYSLGVFHFDQIAAWSDENVAWVDQYLRLQGRIVEEEWVEQAGELAEHGPAAARRVLESEDA